MLIPPLGACEAGAVAGLRYRQGLRLLRRPGRRLGVFVNHNRVVKIVIFEVVLEGVMLRRRCRLGLARLLALGELESIVFELLQHRVVQTVQVVIREVIHRGRRSLRPMPGMAMPLEPAASLLLVGQNNVPCTKWEFGLLLPLWLPWSIAVWELIDALAGNRANGVSGHHQPDKLLGMWVVLDACDLQGRSPPQDEGKQSISLQTALNGRFPPQGLTDVG